MVSHTGANAELISVSDYKKFHEANPEIKEEVKTLRDSFEKRCRRKKLRCRTKV